MCTKQNQTFLLSISIWNTNQFECNNHYVQCRYLQSTYIFGTSTLYLPPLCINIEVFKKISRFLSYNMQYNVWVDIYITILLQYCEFLFIKMFKALYFIFFVFTIQRLWCECEIFFFFFIVLYQMQLLLLHLNNKFRATKLKKELYI